MPGSDPGGPREMTESACIREDRGGASGCLAILPLPVLFKALGKATVAQDLTCRAKHAGSLQSLNYRRQLLIATLGNSVITRIFLEMSWFKMYAAKLNA